MIKRRAEKELLILAKQFKAIAIVGPRQSGKTTLATQTFPNLPYVSLENPDTRRFALEDPRGFLAQYNSGVILDEAQRVPEIFSYLQQVLDNTSLLGKFIITGSNNFLLQETISQSLAGRIAYLYLLPFSISELSNKNTLNLNNLIYKGFYPPIYDQPVESSKWYANYIRTYIERDVRQLKNIADLNSFERFIRLCAGRIGQLLNLNSLAIETGVTNKTIASWISVLESSFIIHRIQPHHKNFNKRVIKMAKIYFYDTGLACNLLGITSPEQLSLHYLGGSIFENFVINELLKYRFNRGERHNLFFWRDNIGHEIDVVIENNDKLLPIEIKSGKTITQDYFKGLLFWQKITSHKGGKIIYAGNQNQNRSNGIRVFEWQHLKNPEIFFID
ncbi:MAG: ATP-binding protein [Bacteroidales bacterium]|jgi:predicted AAA+ superfamily ATPase|nr:ATP-binding protein [Bacteroidales bacterium]